MAAKGPPEADCTNGPQKLTLSGRVRRHDCSAEGQHKPRGHPMRRVSNPQKAKHRHQKEYHQVPGELKAPESILPVRQTEPKDSRRCRSDGSKSSTKIRGQDEQ